MSPLRGEFSRSNFRKRERLKRGALVGAFVSSSLFVVLGVGRCTGGEYAERRRTRDASIQGPELVAYDIRSFFNACGDNIRDVVTLGGLLTGDDDKKEEVKPVAAPAAAPEDP